MIKNLITQNPLEKRLKQVPSRMVSIKLYYDLLSQPSRALYVFFRLMKIPFEACPVALKKGEHLTEEFKEKYNRFQKVPFIHDGDLKLSESVAIIRYIKRKFSDKIPDHWYPQDNFEQAKVDEYLEWQHLNTRAFCAVYFRDKFMVPMLTGQTPNPQIIKKREENLVAFLDQFEDLWLNQGHEYVVNNKISIADLVAACELEQPSAVGFDVTVGRPKLKAWIDKIRLECNPHYQDAHEIVYKLAKRNEPIPKL
ncbi:glutathione S-transferase theta-1-like [Cylas formicarius]|uniref:glutathione S-transferase theta-1-like n=1 Tax=Cylas formicarius TaxID=197179 RepID=UPI002958B109|nr:glutathione S-transferase theta-1-like [Cylas formicarius]